MVSGIIKNGLNPKAVKALYGGNVGPKTSLQEHMQLLNKRWEGNDSRLKQIEKLKGELEESFQLLEENANKRERMMKEHYSTVDALQKDFQEEREGRGGWVGLIPDMIDEVVRGEDSCEGIERWGLLYSRQNQYI